MITLQFDPTSTQDVVLMQRVLPLFKPGLGKESVESPELRFWANLRSRLGENSLRPMCVEAARLGSFGSIGELARHMGVPEKTVQSWRRNLGRSQPKANAACGTDFHIFVWDDSTGRYVVPPALAEAILATEKRLEAGRGSSNAIV